MASRRGLIAPLSETVEGINKYTMASPTDIFTITTMAL